MMKSYKFLVEIQLEDPGDLPEARISRLITESIDKLHMGYGTVLVKEIDEVWEDDDQDYVDQEMKSLNNKEE